jgi:transposase-like protein
MSAKKLAKKEYFWTNEDKSRSVAAYVATGSFSKSSAITGIPENTIRSWAKQDWFGEEARRVDQTDSDELKSTFTRIAKRAALEVEDRLEHGDEVVTKDGEIIKKKIAGKDLAIISAVAADKRRQQLETPATVAIQSSQEKLISLMQSFIKFANAKEITQEKDYNAKDIFEVVEESTVETGSNETSGSDTTPGSTSPTA